MSEYMPDNNNYTGFNTPMPSQDADEIKSLLKKGNVIRAITLGSVILLGGALIAMQLKNGKEISDISNDVHKTSAELSDVSNMLDNISDNVYDIMEQGCNANNNVNNNNNNNTSPEPYEWEPYTEKPAIYIYAADSFTETQVNLSLYRTDMVSTWPMPDSVDAYTYTWNVGATNDGKLYDKDGNEYSYIFWEATDHGIHDFSSGFCVAGEDTADFLKETLAEIGLNSRESNDFITYWLPRMQNNAYNLITFEGLVPDDAYNSFYGLEVTDAAGNPADSMLRVLMVWKSVDRYTDITPQLFPELSREGLTVVEWGGAEISD